MPRTDEIQGRFCLKWKISGEFFVRKGIQFSEVNAANAGRNDPSKQFNVNDWNADNGNDNVFAVPVVVSRRIKFRVCFAWWSGSNHQASCLFPARLVVVLGSFYLLAPGYLCLISRGFLTGLILYLFVVRF